MTGGGGGAARGAPHLGEGEQGRQVKGAAAARPTEPPRAPPLSRYRHPPFPPPSFLSGTGAWSPLITRWCTWGTASRKCTSPTAAVSLTPHTGAHTRWWSARRGQVRCAGGREVGERREGRELVHTHTRWWSAGQAQVHSGWGGEGESIKEEGISPPCSGACP